MKQYARYVALGDSQTEGLDDPDGRGGLRGWADRFAEHAAVTSPDLQYANLAVRGLLVREIRTTQLDVALAMLPDVATVMGGLNDMLRPSLDLDAVLADLDAMLGALTDRGAATLTCTLPDVARIAALFAPLAPRVTCFNAGIRDIAAARGAIVVDFARRGVGADLRIWSPDHIHTNPVGHAVIAAAFAQALGLPGSDERWAEPRIAAGATRRTARTRSELRWIGGTVLPWLIRQARGRSSGEGRGAKRPHLLPVRGA